MRLLFTLFSIAALFVNHATAQTPARSAAELAKHMGPDREKLLHDGAKKEGKLVSSKIQIENPFDHR
ncbi:MAG: hypothetical protein FJ145_05660 [Deltaproteobacteria bacterium]|nr:hypothetical protein [Deltaproteobacteria bacterium]